MNKNNSYKKTALRIYAAISGAVFGGAFVFFIINPLLQVVFAIVSGGRDTGSDWLVFL